MPDVTLQINEPKITPSPTYPNFKVRYREKGGVVWVDDPTPRSNTPYVYSFPGAAVVWEMEITLVQGEGDECPAAIYEIPIREGCNCLTEVSHNVSRPGIISLNYTLPETQPPCGWIIVIVNASGNRRTLYFNSLPPGGIDLVIALDESDKSVEIYANCCNEIISTPVAFD